MDTANKNPADTDFVTAAMMLVKPLPISPDVDDNSTKIAGSEYRKARVIVTTKCDRTCRYCCNSYPHILQQARKIQNISDIKGYDEIIITGGEPLLDANRTLDLIMEAREYNTGASFYLYTAVFTTGVWRILPWIEGLHYTIHSDASAHDIGQFENMQRTVGRNKHTHTKSHFLTIANDVSLVVPVIPDVWTQVRTKPFKSESECHVPKSETLFLLKEV